MAASESALDGELVAARLHGIGLAPPGSVRFWRTAAVDSEVNLTLTPGIRLLSLSLTIEPVMICAELRGLQAGTDIARQRACVGELQSTGTSRFLALQLRYAKSIRVSNRHGRAISPPHPAHTSGEAAGGRRVLVMISIVIRSLAAPFRRRAERCKAVPRPEFRVRAAFRWFLCC